MELVGTKELLIKTFLKTLRYYKNVNPLNQFKGSTHLNAEKAIIALNTSFQIFDETAALEDCSLDTLYEKVEEEAMEDTLQGEFVKLS